ncbi:stage II sporulation protein D [Alkalibacillus salilacus]|uniref:Stage II sporulation protein D n=1 Tax=Alkalibacillus salilacus TaxID=284582 RepID=A0ABT9VI24_9BACI|nr:stage II sporulation protein D [Alkalibacillus salilacus]MDQ0160614.1 stage II sporulation protein D [Alkalibacillus salilacus]
MQKQSMMIAMILVAVIVMIPTMIVLPFHDTPTEAAPPSNDTNEQTQANGESVTVKIKRTESEQIDELPLDQYVTQVVASEIPAEFEMEALKAQALAARTYIANKMAHTESDQAFHVKDTVDDQVFHSENELRDMWGVDYSDHMQKIESAVQATEGEIITYDGEPITAAFFSTSNGFTENAEDYWQNEIPYLKSVSSPWDEASPVFNDQAIFTYAEVAQNLGLQESMVNISDLTRTESGRVDTVTINDETFSGREVREQLGLRSNDFEVETTAEHIIFKTNGYGHGVGMSQYGANGMAKEGSTYKEIVHHYYQGVSVEPLQTFVATK